ncbi:hypothetical protein [uncultured Bacteroides sp.]|uniref:hypothetical protein n=1 Tax=uncultured Bacteroides sp. TaxID=162156 RepID=UPI0026179B59|nr:hypothetical protein [uncultured Bacteroides sp.]
MIHGKEEIMRELFNIEPHSTGLGFLMKLKTGEIDVPDERGGYIISSGCGSGKTESIKSLIRNKYNEGILYCVDTLEEIDKMYRWIIENLVDVMPGLKKEDVMIISSDDEHYISLSEYKDNPEIIMQKKILLITHVRFWTDLINFFLIYKPTSDVDPFDGDFRKLMTRDYLRGYIVFDETPTFIKPFVTFSSVIMGNFTDIDNEGKTRSKKPEDIERFYDLFIKGTSSEIFNTKYRIGRIKKQVALNLIPCYCDSWSISGKKELSISFYPVDLCPDNTTINTHILIFEGVGDILFKDIRNYKLLDTSEKYNTVVDFQKLEFGITRKNHNDSLFERVMSKIAGLITEPTLIISWKEINDEKSDSGNSGYCERIRNALLGKNVDCSLFHVTYYGANDNKSTNSFRDYKQIVLLGDWNLPNTESSKIRRAYGMTTDTQDYKDWFFIQLISRIGIRKHIKGESYKVIYTDDFDSWFIQRMTRYFNDNLIIRKHSLTNNDWEKKIEEMKIRKNTKEEIIKLVGSDNNLQNAIIQRKEYSINVGFDYLENIGIKRYERERERYRTLIETLKKIGIELNIL